jgi:hypothetical protein
MSAWGVCDLRPGDWVSGDFGLPESGTGFKLPGSCGGARTGAQ